MMFKKFIFTTILIFVVLVVIAFWGVKNIENNTVSTKSFKMQNPQQTATVEVVKAEYSITYLDDNTISIEKSGVQLVLHNSKGNDLYYFSEGTNTQNIGKNDSFGYLLRYKNNDEIPEEFQENLKYSNNYFYTEKEATESTECENKFGCAPMKVNANNYGINIFCSVVEKNSTSECDNLLLSLNFKVE